MSTIDATSFEIAIKCIIDMPLRFIVSIELWIKARKENESADKYLHLRIKSMEIQTMDEMNRNIFGEIRGNASASKTDIFSCVQFQIYFGTQNDSIFRI